MPPATWQADSQTLDRYKAYLHSVNMPFTDEEFEANKEWIRSQLRWELLFRCFDKQTADRAVWQSDPEVQKGIESMPKAEALLKEAQKTFAMRN